MAFTLPPLPYPADALEAAIDKTTMEIHHDKHHKAYVDNLNKALENQPQLQSRSLVQLLSDIKSVPEGIRQAVINNGGGTINHNMFWEVMGPKGGGDPTGPLAEAIRSTFNDFATLKQKIKETGLARFGSGWSWLVLSGGKLQVLSTANQDSPYMSGQVPILGVDVWEHAYYLRYQNRRPDYLGAWWDVVNWDEVGRRYEEARSS
jgi:Fe-Mn family superoxide dismutase